MKSNKTTEDISVFLVDGSESEVAGIKDFLRRNIAPSFAAFYYASPQEAIKFLKERSVDVILLDFEVTEQINAKEVFKSIHDAAKNTPVIIFAGEAEHDLALLIMKEGAADSVSREIFIARPERLRNAIESALARKEAGTTRSGVVLTDIREKGATELRQSEEKGAAGLKESQKKGAAELLQAEEKGATELRESESKGAAELKGLHAKRLADVQYHKQVLSWMGGGYSVESVDYEQGNGGAWNTLKNESAALEHVQKKNATALKESQINIAVKMKESQEVDATDLKTKQLNAAAALKESQEKKSG